MYLIPIYSHVKNEQILENVFLFRDDIHIKGLQIRVCHIEFGKKQVANGRLNEPEALHDAILNFWREKYLLETWNKRHFVQNDTPRKIAILDFPKYMPSLSCGGHFVKYLHFNISCYNGHIKMD